MRKAKISDKDHLKAEIRNKLTLPLNVLNMLASGKNISKKSIRLAISDIKKIVKLLDTQEC